MGQMSILHSDSEIAEKTSESSFLFWKLALVSLQQGRIEAFANAELGKLQPIRPNLSCRLFWMTCKLRTVLPFLNG